MLPQTVAQILRGFVMGSADVVPGVSGGTVALVLGIYERLVMAIRAGAVALGRLARGNVRGAVDGFKAVDWLFLVPLLVGIGLAVVTLAHVIETALHDHPEEMAGLFFGLVLASVVLAWRLVKEPASVHIAIVVVVGVLVALGLGFQAGPTSDPSLPVFFGAGALAICAMILPGISGSFILLMIGMYAPVLQAVNDRDIGIIAVFAAGTVLGLALFSHLLARLIAEHHDVLMAVLIGLMLGSLRVLWPWPNGVGVISENSGEAVDGTGIAWPAADEWSGPLLAAAAGVAAVLVFAWAAARRARRTLAARA